MNIMTTSPYSFLLSPISSRLLPYIYIYFLRDDMLLKDESSLIEIYLSIEGGWFCISDFFSILKKLILE